MDILLWCKNLKFLRKETLKSQQDIATEIGVRQQIYGSWETGRYKPDLWQAYKISQIYEISLQDIIEKDISLHAEIVEKLRERFKINTMPPSETGPLTLPTEEKLLSLEEVTARLLKAEKIIEDLVVRTQKQ